MMKEKFARWHVLFLQYLKRDWKKLILWIVGVGLFASAFVPAFDEIMQGDGAVGLYETMQNPAMISLIGRTPVEQAADYSLGAMYSHMMILFSALFSMVMSVLHVVGHTRKEEDQGLLELVRSFRVGRQANSLAVMNEMLLVNTLLAAFTAIVLRSLGAGSISAEGTLLYGTSVGVAGMIGAVIALVAAQLMPTSAGATGLSLSIIGLLYIIRAGTDIADSALSILNPLSWTYLTYPFTENNYLPLVLAVLFTLLMLILAFALEGGRDMGAGYLPQREGRAQAKWTLLSLPAFLIRLNRGFVIAWFATFILFGASYGALYGDMQSFFDNNEVLRQMFAAVGTSIEVSFTGTIMMVMACIVAILPIVIVNKLYALESRSYLSQLFSTKVSRARLFWVNLALAVSTGMIGLLLSAGSLGGAARYVMADNGSMAISDFFSAGINYVPGMLFFSGLAAFALGCLPKVGKLVYVYLGYTFVLTYFSEILNLPDWVLNTTIMSWIPQMPGEDFSPGHFTVISAVSILLMLAGYIGYKQRDMYEGA